MKLVEEIKQVAKENNCVEIEVYKFKDKSHHIHTDFVEFVCFGGDSEFDLIPESAFESYEVMNEGEYDRTLHANTERADFNEWYGNKDAKVMVVMLKEDYDV